MENKENRSFINKKAYEDQWARLGEFSVGALSLFSLSYSWTFRFFLEHSGIGVRKIKKVKRKQISSRERQDQVITTDFIVGINLHVYFPC